MTLRLGVIALVLLTVCGGTACHAQEAAADTGDIDARLAKKISYEAWHTPLKTILADLSKTSGVALKAGYNQQDWQVRDRKMNIYVKDTSLAQLMSSIARVMKFKWSRNSKADPPTYRLILDRKTLASMQAEQARLEDDLHEQVVEARQRCVEGLAKTAGMSDSEAEKLRTENPYLYLCWKTGFAKLATQMFDEIPGLRNKFVAARNNLNPNVSLLSPQTQQLYVDVIKNFIPYRGIWVGWPMEMKAEVEHIKGSALGMENQPRPFTSWRRGQLACHGGLGSGTPKGFYHAGAFYDPDAGTGRAWAEALLRGVEEGRDPKERDKAVWAKETEEMDKSLKETEKYLLVDPISEHADEPGLHKKVKIEVNLEKAYKELDKAYYAYSGAAFRAFQKAIAKAADLNVVSDSFTFMDGRYAPPSGETEIKEILDSIAKTYFYNWEKHGLVLEFRHRDWFRKRCSQIPDEWVEKWRSILLEKGTFTLDEYVPLATLSFDQLEENIGPDPVLCCCTSIGDDQWNLVNNWALLKLYSSLSSSERAQVFMPGGLNLFSVNQDRWQKVEELFTFGLGFSWDTERFLNMENGLVLTAEVKNPPDSEAHYTFIASTSDGKDRRVWYLSIPRYTPPAVKKEANGK